MTQEAPPETSRSAADIQAAVLGAACTQCRAYIGCECCIHSKGSDPLHFARYERALVMKLITPEELESARLYIGSRQFVNWPQKGQPDAPAHSC